MKKVDAIIIGSGFGGIGMAHTLKEKGIQHFQIWEKESDIGGCWRDNHYPGAACDVPSHLYSYSFAPHYPWSRKFAPQQEIHGYIHHCAKRFELDSHIHLNKKVEQASFDETTGLWSVTDQHNETIQCRFLITATGQLNEPSTPEIKGLEQFEGPVFHSARWQHDIDLNNKSVGVIGTGASAIQFVPELTKFCKQLNVFQRTPPYVIPKPDRAYGPFRKWLFKHIPIFQSIDRFVTYLQYESRFLAFRDAKFLMIPYRWYWLRFLNKQVKNSEKRTSLTPDYDMGCKRILISNEFYSAMDQDHVHLNTNGINHIDKKGIVDKNGNHHPVDAIIFGTGFKATDFLSNLNIIGRQGLSIKDAWAKETRAYKGICVHGFPNLFMLYGPNTNLGHNSIIYMLESQFKYIAKAIQYCRDQNFSIDVKADKQNHYNTQLQAQLSNAVWQTNCNSWYKTENGNNPVNWSDFTFKYRRATRSFDPSAFESFKPAN